ncbi:thiamine ABC transporter ATP-binding protein ThiQ [Candidatus Pantoea soli]|uniref:Thiamine ABC transporter ATP-binding protein ThiQ n=1 Tax=Candidatus Pantoea soli TaxID=3098669 RepID=A0A518X9S2_9GAMM|nr:thiamine ABC transporter ATP-binding protein ThiQ [Pantoea soli]QDY40957.1 thiamine ABC transporter ATP-binding protein ThiQ [Pantoea soli]
MLTLNNLTYLYQHLPMRFSFHAEAGERLAILGPSGAGKSTLLSLLGGFLPVSQGELHINGVDHTHSVPSARPVSMLFQENNLFPHLTVQQNMGLGLHPGLKLTRDQQQQLLHVAHQTGLQEMLSRLPGQLSGGQRQRVALARCLLRNQPVLLLDEPFSALDPALRGEMLQRVREVCEARQITLLMVSHSLEDAQQIAARSLVIVDGRVWWDGPTAALLRGENAAAAILGVKAR